MRSGPSAGRVTVAAAVGLVTGPLLGALALVASVTSYALVPVGVGVPMVGDLPRKLQRLAWLERARARGLLRARLPEAPPRAHGPGGLAGLRAAATDHQAWRELGWLGGQVLLGPVVFALVVALWAGPLFLLTVPTWAWAVDRFPLGLLTVTSVPDALAVGLVGALLLPVAALLVRALGRRVGAGAGRWLGPDERQLLVAKVADLERTRAIAVSAADSERHRLERDLHDGAQSRLVSLAVTLALAEEALDRDAEASRTLLMEARGEAVAAVEDLRSLARGLSPTVLRTRGLRAGLDGLAATSAVPVEVRTDGYTRAASSQLETALYFVAAEALANAAKHAGASAVVVELSAGRDGCLLEVRDDGRGGARLQAGGGLAGLQARLAPLDAVLEVDSDGTGTTVRVRA